MTLDVHYSIHTRGGQNDVLFILLQITVCNLASVKVSCIQHIGIYSCIAEISCGVTPTGISPTYARLVRARWTRIICNGKYRNARDIYDTRSMHRPRLFGHTSTEFHMSAFRFTPLLTVAQYLPQSVVLLITKPIHSCIMSCAFELKLVFIYVLLTSFNLKNVQRNDGAALNYFFRGWEFCHCEKLQGALHRNLLDMEMPLHHSFRLSTPVYNRRMKSSKEKGSGDSSCDLPITHFLTLKL